MWISRYVNSISGRVSEAAVPDRSLVNSAKEGEPIIRWEPTVPTSLRPCYGTGNFVGSVAVQMIYFFLMALPINLSREPVTIHIESDYLEHYKNHSLQPPNKNPSPIADMHACERYDRRD